MSLDTSKKILKIFGIINIVAGILAIILGILALAGGGMVASVAGEDADAATVGGLAILGGIIILVSGIVSLISGIFSTKAANDTSRIKPAWVFAIIGIVFSVISLLTNLKSGSFFSGILSIALNAVIFYAANTIKKDVEGAGTTQA